MKIIYVQLESLQDLLCKPIDHVLKYKDVFFFAEVAANFMVVYYTRYEGKVLEFIRLEQGFELSTSSQFKSGYVPVVNVESIKESDKFELEFE